VTLRLQVAAVRRMAEDTETTPAEEAEEEEEARRNQVRAGRNTHTDSCVPSTDTCERKRWRFSLQVYVRVDPAQQHWWWVFMRLRYAFMFATVFVVTAIYMLSIQSQLLLWVFYYSTKYAPRESSSQTRSFWSLSRYRWGDVVRHRSLVYPVFATLNRVHQAHPGFS